MIRLSRLSPGQTRYGVFSNLNSPLDMETLRLWYVDVHYFPLYLSMGGKIRYVPERGDVYAAVALAIFAALLLAI